jgi:hypothetical protein
MNNMTLYELIQTWDVETLAEFLTVLLESNEDNLLESASRHLPEGIDVSLVSVDHDVRKDKNIELLMQEQKVRDCTTCIYCVSCEPNPFGICDEYEELI